jgi:hypothetical protein
MRPARLILPLLLVAPLAGHAEEPLEVEEVAQCARRNLPEPDTIRAVRIVERDRVGAERTTVVKIYVRRTGEKRRQVLIRFEQPEELRGSAFLMLEREGENELYFKSTELPAVKRISGPAKAEQLLGGDFSYEDFEYLQGFSQPGEWKRLEDAAVSERPVYVVETRPTQSAYQRVVAFVDKKTCVALRIEFFESSKRLRKVLTVNPRQVLKRGSVWLPHMALMRNIEELTTTMFLVDSSQQGPIPEGAFDLPGVDTTEH